jgi:hypothetical protein
LAARGGLAADGGDILNAGDEAAFVEFVAGHQARLQRMAYAMSGDWDRAEDPTRETGSHRPDQDGSGHEYHTAVIAGCIASPFRVILQHAHGRSWSAHAFTSRSRRDRGTFLQP